MQAPTQSQTSMRTLLGILALVLSGLMFVVGIPIRGALVDLGANPANAAPGVAGSGYQTGWIIITVGFYVQTLGFLGLYGYLRSRSSEKVIEGLAFWGLILSIVGTLAALSPLGFEPFGAPAVAKLYLAGDTQVVQVATASLSTVPAVIFLSASGVLYMIGSILIGVALWRSGTLLKWAAIPYVLQAPMISFGSQLSFVIEFLGALFLLASSVLIAWTFWQESARTTATSSQTSVARV